MSRIGKIPVVIPPKVKVEVKGQQVLVEGPKGKLKFDLPKRTSLKVDKENLLVSRDGDDAQAKALHGLSRALINNMVRGVSEGFVKKLEIQGVGFKAAVQGKVGPSMDQSNCRYDVNATGTITNGDVAAVQGKVGSHF